MKISILGVLLICSSIFLNAQTKTISEDNELKITKCDFEPDAPAVILFDKGKTEFYDSSEGFKIHFTRQKRVKIFKESAFDQGEIEIHLYQSESDMEQVEDIEATTYYYDGDKLVSTILDKSQVYKEPINKWWYKIKFAMPGLKEGCIIDFKYTVISPFLTAIPDWEFQDDIPTLYSEYKTCMIPFYTYQFIAQGIGSFDIKKNQQVGSDRTFMGMTFKDMEYTFGLKNVPSFKDEGYISSREDYIKKIDFQICEIHYPSGYTKKYMTTWPDLAKEFLDSEMFGKYIKKCTKYGEKEFSSLSSLSDEEKINSVIDYVKKNYKYNGTHNKWASTKFNDFLKEKTGNSANINLLALGMLNGIGVNAKPVIISTRDHGKITGDFPFSSLFNNVVLVAELDGKPYILDATDGYCDNLLAPADCYNGKGFLVEEGSETWVNIRNIIPSKHHTQITFSIDPNESETKGNAVFKSTGHIGLNSIKRYNSDKDKFAKDFKEDGLDINGEVKVIDKEAKNTFSYEFEFTGNIEKIEDQIIITPFFKLPIQENPFKQPNREYAIDFVYPRINTYTAEIEIPQGYQLEKLPPSFKSDNDNLNFTYNIYTKENKIRVTASYQIKKPEYPASDYRNLKYFYKILTEKINQSIVLTKDNSITQL